MSKCLISCLHGFLGLGKDWGPFNESLIEELITESPDFWCPDLLTADSKLNPQYLFSEWSQKFNETVKAKAYDKNILIGYSMGGRLALHAVFRKPRTL